MIDTLRGEFPGASGLATRLRKPIVSRESVGWAFLSAAGAGFIASGIVGLLLFSGFPGLFPSTEPRPSWLTYAVITQIAAAIAAGAVAGRSGGRAALALYALYQLFLIVAAFPARQRSCLFVNPAASFQQSCDIPGMIVDRWPMWLAVAIGAVGFSWLLRTDGAGANQLLRGAGVFGVALTAATFSYGLLTITTLAFRDPSFEFIFTGVYVSGQLIGGILAGLVLRRAPLAASVLLSVLIVSTLAAGLPLAIRNAGPPTMPWQMAVLQWSGVAGSILGAAGVLVVRLFASRERETGTIS